MPVYRTVSSGPAHPATPGDQIQPAVSALANGRYIVTWTGPGGNPDFPGETGLYGQIYDAAGTPQGGALRLRQTSPGFQFDGEVTGLADGGFVIAWTGIDGSGNGVFARRFDASGFPVGNDVLVNTDQAGSEENPAVATLADGSFVIVWQAGSIFGQRFAADGNRIGSQFEIDMTDGFAATPNVAPLAGGGFVVSWHGPDGDGNGAFARVYAASGAAAGDAFQVNAVSAGAQSPAAVAALADGGFAVMWSGDKGGTAEIVVQRFGAGGQRIGGEIVVTDSSSAVPGQPDIAALADGGFVAVWRAGGLTMLRRYDAAGQPVGDEWPAASPVPGDFHNRPAVAGLPDGSFVVTWSGSDGDGAGIYAVRFADGDELLTEAAERAMGTAGSDYLMGFGGDDELRGGDGDDVLEGGLGADLLIGGAGRDEASYAWAEAAVSLNFATGLHSGEAAGDRFESIEQFALSRFADRFIGGAAAETVLGGGGNDLLVGNGGNDDLQGGAGDDVLEGGLGADILNGGEGVDEASFARAAASVSIDLGTSVHGGEAQGDAFFSIERFTLSRFGDSFIGSAAGEFVAGGAGDDTLFGMAGDDILDGGTGDDLLDGGSGADELRGLAGNDTYHVDDVKDVVFEAAGGGNDRLFASVSYALAAGQEVELIAARDRAGTQDLHLTGNAFAQRLEGNDGANLLNGNAGADIMIGYKGDDHYVVDQAGDQVIEAVGGGTDTVWAGVSYALAGGQEVEVMSTRNHSGTEAIDLTGNAFNQTLMGNFGNNLLNGNGGADVMIGMRGDDRYIVDNVLDQVIEKAGEGVDTVSTSVSYALAGGQEVEILSTRTHSGTEAIDLTGNAFDQTLYGNFGNNLLNGNGGADIMIGFKGDDRYVVDNAGDQVVEAVGGGNDTVVTSISYALAAGQEIETLSTRTHSGTDAIALTGNAFGQALIGNFGANWLDGKGGSDTLTGFAGADTFAFTTSLGPANVDRITDFQTGIDRIALDDAVFAGLAPGALAAGAFVTGTAAGDADDRILYDAATGALYFDADGNGAGAAVQFATLSAGLSLTAADFMII